VRKSIANKTVAGILAAAAPLALFAAMSFFVDGCTVLPLIRPVAEPFIAYRVALADHRLSVVRVEAFVYGLGEGRLVLRAPENETGSSLVPINLSAAAAGAALDIRERDGAWHIKTRSPDFVFSYDVVLTIEDRYSPDVRSMLTFMGEDRCRILGRDVFLVPEAPFASGVIVDMDLFPGRGLSSSAPAVRERVIVPDTGELSRTMAAAGAYRFLEREIGGTALSLAIGDTWSFGDEEFFGVLCRIVAEELALLGPPPQSRYLFICERNPVRGAARFDYYGIHYGGSMLLLLDSRIDRGALMDAPMAVVAHEFFHNWNGETLAGGDDAFLWFTEGATVYCSYRILVRANVLSPEQHAAHRRTVIARYRANPHRERVAVGEAGNSDMWDKDMVNLLYDGGYLAAEALDERIRAETDGASGLIDVIRYLHERSSRPNAGGEAALVAAVADLGGADISRFLGELIHTPNPRELADRFSILECADER
jgi:predicted metalloprotease with PDZ domain